MIELLSGWITSITAASILSAAALTVTPKGGVRKAVELICGVIIVLAVLSPVTRLRYKDIELSFPDMSEDKIFVRGMESGQAVLKKLIQERTGAYIESKAQALGLKAVVTCEVIQTKEGVFLPSAVCISTAAPPEEKIREELCQWIAAECGVSRENQVFTAGGS